MHEPSREIKGACVPADRWRHQRRTPSTSWRLSLDPSVYFKYTCTLWRDINNYWDTTNIKISYNVATRHNEVLCLHPG